MPPCPRCHDPHTKKDGRTARGQRYRCHGCRRTFTDRTGTPFASYRWERDIIALAVHWYCSYRLSAANVRDLLAERGLDVSARTVLTWVQTVGPLLTMSARWRRAVLDATLVVQAPIRDTLLRAAEEELPLTPFPGGAGPTPPGRPDA